jgi:hypothetical protein
MHICTLSLAAGSLVQNPRWGRDPPAAPVREPSRVREFHDDGANFKPIRTLWRTAWGQNQAGGPRISPVAAQEFIYLALAEPQLQTGVRDSLIRQPRAHRQQAEDRFPPASSRQAASGTSASV